ncbi:hypothetical protein RSOLAG1IB_07871 [Rhizoctonia solani AG-1 IB]|uniref:Methyltransferase n=1 Tax=Thanatephorus cucumeris (strain AG1-IB / isolate 7/3/14) TaxID=1108050 RepID=M5C0A7_THACB|nr:hypothetical protein BN14_03336 [Rhizoctonia solani AG-1 IB]CEL56522.1 hypothetical protein RSOLAG1IB_07871 [Rhizoctonia solani AG-1 IB]
MALVDTRINYFNPPADGSKPYQWTTANHPGGGPMRNWEPLEHAVQVQNIRGQETGPEYGLDRTGFEFHRIPNKADIDFNDDEDIKAKYYAESIENIKNITGASRVVIFDHTLRKPRPAGTPETPENRSPVKLAHVDQTNDSAKRRVHLHLPEADVPGLLSKRFQIINLWRPIANAAWQYPLALCDFRSVQDGDFVPSTLKYLDRDGETLVVKYNPEHRWKYLAGMTPDELVLIKCFDSVQSNGVATFTPHTAIDDPNTPSDAPDRQSIELRALVFYD